MIASGHAKVEAQRIGGPVLILDINRNPRWHDLWSGLPWITNNLSQAKGAVLNGSGCRPYIKYPFTRSLGGCVYSGWRARDFIGSIALTDSEIAWAHDRVGHLGDFILVEPELLAKANPNKQWSRLKWGRLVDMLNRWTPVIQLTMNGIKAIDGTIGIPCYSFRLACAVITLADKVVVPEGGLHHAAAVLNRPAVVLFGGSPSPESMGYPTHTNIAAEKHCGSWVRCPHCDQFWDDLTPEYVYSKV